MFRIVLLAAAASLAALPVRAQSLEGSIWSGFSSGLGGGFQSGIAGDLNSGFGATPRRRRAQTEDVTLGAQGGFSAGFLRGQPSNFGPSVQSMVQPRDAILGFGNGPETSLDLGAGPAGPLD